MEHFNFFMASSRVYDMLIVVLIVVYLLLLNCKLKYVYI